MRHQPFTYILFTRLSLLLAISVLPSGALSSCASFAKSEATFEGLFATSFEVSVFYPCDMSTHTKYIDGLGYKDLGYWLRSTPDSGFNEQVKTFSSLTGPTGLRVYIKFNGILSPTKQNGGYGHLGMYDNEVTVTKILDMKPWSENLCY